MKKTSRIVVLAVAALCVMMLAFGLSASADTSAASVTIDGQAITFTDAYPQNVNSRIMVPYRAMFEALGATVDYDAATGTISGSLNGTSLSMKNGDSAIQVTEADGTTSTVTMDVAPFISDAGRTYVPTRFVSQVLGYSVGWDNEAKTVVIVDTDSIAKDASSDFSILSKTAALSPDQNKTYDVTGTYAGTVKMDPSALSGLTGTDTAAAATSGDSSISGNISGLIKGSDTDLGMTADVTSGTDKTSMNMNVKLDSKAGMAYVGVKTGDSATTWLSMDMNKMMTSEGFSWDSLISGSANTSDMKASLSSLFDSMSGDYKTTAYSDLSNLYNAVKSTVGDAAFTKDGNTYKATFDGKTAAAIASIFSGTGGAASSLANSKISGDIAIVTDNAGNAVSCTLNVKMSMDDAQNGTMSMDLNSVLTKNAQTAKINMTLGKIMTMDLSMDLKYAESSKTVDTSLPAGVTAISIDDLLSSITE